MIPLPEWAPNIHPLFVHFPIALLFSAALFDLIALLAKDRWSLRVTAVSVYVLGAVAAIATYLTGDAAADHLSIPLDVQTLLSDHSDWALRTVWFYGVYGVVRLVMLRFRGMHMWARTLAFVIGAAGLLLVVETGEHGAEMVFEHGIGVQAVSGLEHEGYEEDHDHEGAEDHDDDDHDHDADHADDLSFDRTIGANGKAEQSFTATDDGSWFWSVKEDVVDVMTKQARFLQGSLDALDATTDGSSLSIRLTGDPVLFVIGGDLASLQATTSLNLDDFDGTAELVHHVRGEQDFDFLAVEGGTIKAGRMSKGQESVFDTDDFHETGWISMVVVSDGRHTRGYAGDELRVHGHSEPPQPGPVGLYFHGTGVVQIRDLGVKVLRR
ncbi:MAG: DUF2231 domain-containing protein [Rhodothermales bacterium]